MARIRASLVLLVRPTGRSTPSPLVIGDPRNRMEDLRPELPVTVSVSNPRMARSLRGCHAVRGTARWPCVCHRRCIMLVIDSVDKLFPGGVQALCGFSIARGPGILGLLGPNGAGKSTLMRILATVTRPTAGRVLWQGQDVVAHPQELRRVLGYLPQDFGVYPNLSAREFLAYLAAVKGLAGRRARARVDELLELVNLTAAGRRPLGSFSGGMRQRVGIAQALLDDPRLLIVDEPTAGLDPEERVRFRGLLSDLAGERVVILSMHIVSDVEAVATEIAIIDRGRLVAHGAPEALLRTVEGRVREWTVASSGERGAGDEHRPPGEGRRKPIGHAGGASAAAAVAQRRALARDRLDRRGRRPAARLDGDRVRHRRLGRAAVLALRSGPGRRQETAPRPACRRAAAGPGAGERGARDARDAGGRGGGPGGGSPRARRRARAPVDRRAVAARAGGARAAFPRPRPGARRAAVAAARPRPLVVPCRRRPVDRRPGRAGRPGAGHPPGPGLDLAAAALVRDGRAGRPPRHPPPPPLGAPAPGPAGRGRLGSRDRGDRARRLRRRPAPRPGRRRPRLRSLARRLPLHPQIGR